MVAATSRWRPKKEAKGLPSRWRRTTLLILAFMLHNVPEGVVFAASGDGPAPVSLAGALGLMGGAFHDLPEGMAVTPTAKAVLLYAMGFAASAMPYVVVREGDPAKPGQRPSGRRHHGRHAGFYFDDGFSVSLQ